MLFEIEPAPWRPVTITLETIADFELLEVVAKAVLRKKPLDHTHAEVDAATKLRHFLDRISSKR